MAMRCLHLLHVNGGLRSVPIMCFIVCLCDCLFTVGYGIASAWNQCNAHFLEATDFVVLVVVLDSAYYLGGFTVGCSAAMWARHGDGVLPPSVAGCLSVLDNQW